MQRSVNQNSPALALKRGHKPMPSVKIAVRPVKIAVPSVKIAVRSAKRPVSPARTVRKSAQSNKKRVPPDKTLEKSAKTAARSVKAVVKTALSARQTYKRQAEVFKALGHPGRMAIVHALSGGEVCACRLATVAGRAASTTSRHLMVLKHAGLIADERRGQQVFYHLTCPCVLTFAECINQVDAGKKIQTLRVPCGA